MTNKKNYKGIAVLAIFLFVAIMAVGDFGGLFSVYTYGGTTQYYLADSTHAADVVDLTGSRNSAEIFSGCSDAKHQIDITRLADPVYGTTMQSESRVKSLGTLTYRPTLTPKFVFSDGSYTSSFSYSFYPATAGDYIAKEAIYCFGTPITDVKQINFKVSARPTSTPTITKVCGNLGMNQKTRSCYYKTCEVQANGNWDWSTEKQSSSFCDYVPPVTPPAAPPATPPSCTPDWKTTDWSPCINSTSTRMVTDNNNCANPSTTPPTTEKACEMPAVNPPANNGSGSTIDPLQYCKDKGFTGYDAATNTCAKAGASDTTDFVSKYKWYIVGVIIGLSIWIAVLVPYLSRRK